MRRVLALVAAAAMVAGSIAIRSRIDRRAEDRTNPVRVVCAAELGPVCDALPRTAQVSVEPAPETADRLATTEAPEIDGWLVPAPWPQIVDLRRRQHALPEMFGDPGAPLARSPLVLVVQRELENELRPRCGGTVDWKCLGAQAAGGPAKPGHADPQTNGIATLLIGQATAAFFGRLDLSTLDLDDPGFGTWFRSLELAAPRSPSGASPLDDMLGTGFAAYNAVGTIEAEAKPVLAASTIRDRVDLLYPAPMATADVVLADTGAGARRLRETARLALAGAGWNTAASGLPATNGLPSPGFLDALRARAAEFR